MGCSAMANTFHVRLTLYFLDGTTSLSIVDIADAIALDRALKNGSMPKDKDSIIDLHYETLREFPDDTEAA